MFKAIYDMQKTPQRFLQKPRGGKSAAKQLPTKIAQAAKLHTDQQTSNNQPNLQLLSQLSTFTDPPSKDMHELYSESETDSSDPDDDDNEEEDSQGAPNLKSNQEDQDQNYEDDVKGSQADYTSIEEEDQEPGGEEDDQALHHKICRAAAQVRRGNINKALNILTQGRLRKITPQVEEALKAKHPTPHANAVPPVTPVFPKNIVDQDLLLKVLRGLRNGSARSAAGWTAELLYDIAKDDLIIASATTALATRILNNDLNSASRFQLTISRLIAADKGENDIRPLTIAELFYKLAATYAIRLNKDAISRILEPLGQFGIGAQGGSQRALHLVQILLETSGPQATGLFVDLKNMYNDFNRYKALSYLFSFPELQHLW